jgi:26S proteasome non-ATPase regulatory subunit 5
LQSWGRAEILGCPGFTEFLLDRDTERDKAGKEARWQLLVSLSHAEQQVVELVGRELDFLIKEYVRLGPFYVAATSQVAFQSGN